MDGFEVNESDMKFSGMDFGDIGNSGVGFTDEYFQNDDALHNRPSSPMIINQNYDEPNELFMLEDNAVSPFKFNIPKIPKLTKAINNIEEKRKDSNVKVTIKKVPLTDEEADKMDKDSGDREEVVVVQKKRIPKRFSNYYEDIRYQVLDAGGQPLTAEEALNYSRGRSFRGKDVFDNT